MGSDDNKVDAVTQVVISIHAPRMGSDVVLPDTFTVVLDISIHAPRMGSDQTGRRNDDPSMISIHAPRMGSDHNQTGWGATIIKIAITVHIFKFQSTLPGWGATTRIGVLVPLVTHFNPRSPDGERHRPPDNSNPTPRYFNPRSPDGERLSKSVVPPNVSRISIHAPRMGSDRLRFETPQIKAISIHAPRMGSDAVSWPSSWRGTRFQSTLPGWGAT